MSNIIPMLFVYFDFSLPCISTTIWCTFLGFSLDPSLGRDFLFWDCLGCLNVELCVLKKNIDNSLALKQGMERFFLLHPFNFQRFEFIV